MKEYKYISTIYAWNVEKIIVNQNQILLLNDKIYHIYERLINLEKKLYLVKKMNKNLYFIFFIF